MTEYAGLDAHSPLGQLAQLLRPAAEEGSRPMSSPGDIDRLLAQMEAQSKGRKAGQLSADQQLDAVRRFWESREVKSFRDAYLLSWSLGLSHRPQGPCILEDRHRLQLVLDGVDGWQGRPGAFRRCYQGLVKSYFTFDGLHEDVDTSTRENWWTLRGYLADRNGFIKDDRVSPAWVDVARDNPHLFGTNPCEPHVDALLRGDSSAIDYLCEQLGINKASWFLRELVLAQVRGATKLAHGPFQQLLPRLIDLLAANEVLRDRGMVAVLDRYAEVPGTPLHQALRDHTVAWWGNPWLPSNETRWGGVQPEARTMVADWLKLEFIETFFTKLAEDGLGDPRRMNFWKRYVKAIGHIEFALGATARNSRERDMVVLRKKMTGLVRALDAPGTNNAFIMRMGPLVAVEFSGKGNALYGYDSRRETPFDTQQLLRLEVNGHNSLKNKAQALFVYRHQDGIYNWSRWEDMFEATLRERFGIAPLTVSQGPRRVVTAQSPPPPAPPAQTSARHADSVPRVYSEAALNKFAQEKGLQIDDRRASGGNLWVRTDESDLMVSAVLMRWGFVSKTGKGWWK